MEAVIKWADLGLSKALFSCGKSITFDRRKKGSEGWLASEILNKDNKGKIKGSEKKWRLFVGLFLFCLSFYRVAFLWKWWWTSHYHQGENQKGNSDYLSTKIQFTVQRYVTLKKLILVQCCRTTRVKLDKIGLCWTYSENDWQNPPRTSFWMLLKILRRFVIGYITT